MNQIIVDKMAPRALNIRKIPLYLRNRFKALCAEHNVSMEDAVVEMISQVIYHSDDNSHILSRLQEAGNQG